VPGRACRYPDVVAMLPCPSVSCASGTVAPPSMAWDACAWRSQCGEMREATSSSMPALAAARFTIPCTARTFRAPPPLLLHEMVHQLLFERGEPAGHASDGWRREIMRQMSHFAEKTLFAILRTMTKLLEGAVLSGAALTRQPPVYFDLGARSIAIRDLDRGRQF
jgi:hypothetical protein